MRKLICFICAICGVIIAQAKSYDNPDTLFVARDGTGEFRNINEAIEVCRAFMEYHKVIFVKKGTYKEKLVIPQWLTNIEICGEDRDNTIIIGTTMRISSMPRRVKAWGPSALSR